MKFFMNKIARDTLGLTFISFILQGLGILLNAVMTDKLGTASVGIMTLIFTVFGFIMVLANGNIFTSTSRFVSEELGSGNKNCTRIMRYSFVFSLTLSITFSLLSIILSGLIADKLSAAASLVLPIKIIAISLPFASVGSCIKGYFHAIRKVSVPCTGDCIEFAVKWSLLLSYVLFLTKSRLDVYCFIAISILAGEFVSCIYYICRIIPEYRVFSVIPETNANISAVPRYLKLCTPILISGYVQMILSTANDILVPAALLKYNSSAEKAMSEYGIFEAMIMPTIFYPAVVLGSLANILMPEIARAASSDNRVRVKCLVHNALSKSFMYSFFIAGIFLARGKCIGNIICPSDPLTGETLVKMFPVIPFIYLEIVLESILKGLGKQNFSTVNSLCEYAVRIICVLVFVRKYGFIGVMISYYASNIYSNIIRIIVVCKETHTSFSICSYIFKPFIFAALTCLGASGISKIVNPINQIISAGVFISAAGVLFIMIYETDKMLSADNCSVSSSSTMTLKQ